jgi:hypothetical protein
MWQVIDAPPKVSKNDSILYNFEHPILIEQQKTKHPPKTKYLKNALNLLLPSIVTPDQDLREDQSSHPLRQGNHELSGQIVAKITRGISSIIGSNMSEIHMSGESNL